MARTEYSLDNPTYPMMLHRPKWKSTGLRGMLALHGRGGQALQIQQGLAWAGHPEYMADQGYAVIGVDMGGTSWLNPAAMTAISAAYDKLVAIGIQGTKVGLMGWSMGGGSALRWLQENPAKVSCVYLFNPLTDLDWAFTQAAWTAEINAAYAGSYAANGSTRGPIENISSYQNGIPIRIVHPANDATIPSAQSDAFVKAVNRSYVTIREPIPIIGDHQGGLTQTPTQEVAGWFSKNWQ